MVDRHYDDEPSADRLRARAEYELDTVPTDVLIARLTGRSPQRAHDLLEAQSDRRRFDLEVARQQRLSLARAELAAEREERSAAWEFTHLHLADSRRRLEDARLAREEATDALREACLRDDSAVSAVRRVVRS